jgi:hypothetical protein
MIICSDVFGSCFSFPLIFVIFRYFGFFKLKFSFEGVEF